MGKVIESDPVTWVDVEEDVGIVGRLAGLERDRCRVAAEQYELAYELLRVRVAERVASGKPQAQWETGIAAELGLALSVSPNRAAALLSRARALCRVLPHTLDRLRDADLSPERVEVVIAGLAHLETALQEQADEQLCADPATLGGLGLKRLENRVFQVAYELDRQAMVDRLAKAPRQRRVTMRPVPDAMVRLSILLPVAKGVAVFASLRKRADQIVGAGNDPRTRSQVMADTAYELLTGLSVAEGQPVAVNLTVSDAVLFGGQDGGAFVAGGGPMPADIARNLVGKATAAGRAWVKRLYVRPESGAVVGMDSRSRLFPDGLAEVIRARDRYCRTPFCDAPIAHIDHVVPHASGGATDFENGQGLCAACNYAKEGAGWRQRVVPDPSGRHTVETTSPTGQVYRSTAPGAA